MLLILLSRLDDLWVLSNFVVGKPWAFGPTIRPKLDFKGENVFWLPTAR